MLARTQDQIVARIHERKGDDMLGFEVDEYVPYLDYEHAKAFIKPDVTKEQWEADTKDVMDPRDRAFDYMPFAWDKANNCRGISSNRSISHFIAWLWLDGDDELWPTLWKDYRYYGKPQLEQICQYLGIDPTKHDDGVRTNTELAYT